MPVLEVCGCVGVCVGGTSIHTVIHRIEWEEFIYFEKTGCREVIILHLDGS